MLQRGWERRRIFALREPGSSPEKIWCRNQFNFNSTFEFLNVRYKSSSPWCDEWRRHQLMRQLLPCGHLRGGLYGVRRDVRSRVCLDRLHGEAQLTLRRAASNLVCPSHSFPRAGWLSNPLRAIHPDATSVRPTRRSGYAGCAQTPCSTAPLGCRDRAHRDPRDPADRAGGGGPTGLWFSSAPEEREPENQCWTVGSREGPVSIKNLCVSLENNLRQSY
jgi:hypothetical protein